MHLFKMACHRCRLNRKQCVYLSALCVLSFLWLLAWTNWNSGGLVKMAHQSFQAANKLVRPYTSSSSNNNNNNHHHHQRPAFNVGVSDIIAETNNSQHGTRCTAPSTHMALDTDEDNLLPWLRKSGGLHVQKGLGERSQEARTEFERCLLTTPPLQDFRLAPDPLNSKVYVVSPKPHYHKGERVQVRADLFDGFGNSRTTGGDDIRMRLVAGSGNTSIAADVVDLHNGSYLGTTLLPWTGTAVVQVSVLYPREYLREAVRLRLTLLSMRWIVASYKKGEIQEWTGCLPSVPIPGYQSVCNLTDFNGGLPYFCGQPTDRRLTCGHRRQLKKLAYLHSLPQSAPDRQLRDNLLRGEALRLIPNGISLTIQSVAGQTQSRPNLRPCWKRTRKSSWQTQSPDGWMDNGRWRSLTCSLPGQVDDDHVQQCLHNTSVFIVGDSNMRLWWYELRSHLRCSLEELRGPKPGAVIHQHKLCEVLCVPNNFKVQSHNTTLRWAFHGRPAFNVFGSENIPLPLVLEVMRHHRRHLHRRVVLLLHYYLHFGPFSPGVFQDRVRAAKHRIQAFLREFPDAKVFVRGAHAAFDAIQSDLFAPAYNQIWRHEFRDVRDKVWFLDFWDVSVATWNKPGHPLPWVVREMVKVLLGFICDNF